ncbi:MAG: ArnT family glycosyltransferase [Candidatus Micrarchaeia archaeon]
MLTLLVSTIYLVTHPMAPSFYDDDTSYEMLAHDITIGVFYPSLGYYYDARIMQIYPMALFYKFMGINFLSSAMWDIVSWFIMVILSFYIGKELYNEYVGYLAALIMCVFPLMIYLSGTSKETIPMTLFTTIAFYSAMKGYFKDSSKWYFASGVSIIAAFLCDLLGVIIGPVILLFLLILFINSRLKTKHNGPSIKSLHILSGVAFGIMLVLLYGYILAGNPYVIFQIDITYATVPSFTNFSVITPYYAILLPPFLDNLSGVNIGYIFYLFFIAVPYLLIKKVKESYIPIFWSAFTLLYLWIGPMFITLNPFKYSIIPRGWQYLPIVAVPVALTIGIFIVKLGETFRKHKPVAWFLVGAIVIFIVYSSVSLDIASYYGYKMQMSPIYYLSQYLNLLPNTTTIYLPLQLPNIEVYMNFDNVSRFIYYNQNISSCNATMGYDYVVTTSYTGAFPVPCPYWKEINFSEGRYLPANYIKLYSNRR